MTLTNEPTLGHGQQLCESIVQIQVNCEKCWPGQRVLLCVNCDSDLWDMALDLGHDISLGHETILWIIIQIQDARENL